MYELVVMGEVFNIVFLLSLNKYTLYPVAPSDSVQERVVSIYVVLENVRFVGLAGAVVAVISLVFEFPTKSVAFTLTL